MSKTLAGHFFFSFFASSPFISFSKTTYRYIASVATNNTYKVISIFIYIKQKLIGAITVSEGSSTGKEDQNN
jgi:hypothetical protein